MTKDRKIQNHPNYSLLYRFFTAIFSLISHVIDVFLMCNIIEVKYVPFPLLYEVFNLIKSCEILIQDLKWTGI